MNIYVGNLSKEATADDLRQAFGQFGTVSSASVITDRVSGEAKGFGFVEMPNKEEAQKAITGLNGTEIKNRSITVNEARPKGSGGGGSRGGGGFGGGRGGRGEHAQGPSRGLGRGKWKGFQY